jgi:NAD(P)-dependent dehydrogenase (short-subunit alcohol dehydrogenase family)
VDLQIAAPNPHYVASKAWIIGLTRSYAGLVAGHGVTVNAIAPALIAAGNLNPEICVGPEMVPVGRFGVIVHQVSDQGAIREGPGFPIPALSAHRELPWQVPKSGT